MRSDLSGGDGIQVGTGLLHDALVWQLQWSSEGLQLAVSCEAAAGKGPAVHVWELRADATFGTHAATVYRGGAL